MPKDDKIEKIDIDNYYDVPLLHLCMHIIRALNKVITKVNKL